MSAVAEFIDFLQEQQLKYPITILPGIDIAKLERLENKLSVKLPNDLREFYTHTNGLEGDDLIFNIIPLQDVEKSNDDEGECLIFAEYLIYSDTFYLIIDKGDHNKYLIKSWDEKSFTTNSIIDFIKAYTEKGTMALFYGDIPIDDLREESEIHIIPKIMTKEQTQRIGRQKVLAATGIFVAGIITLYFFQSVSGDFANGILFFFSGLFNIHIIAMLSILLLQSWLFGSIAGNEIILKQKNIGWVSTKYSAIIIVSIIIYATIIGFVKHNKTPDDTIFSLLNTYFFTPLCTTGLLTFVPLLLAWLWATHQMQQTTKKEPNSI